MNKLKFPEVDLFYEILPAIDVYFSFYNFKCLRRRVSMDRKITTLPRIEDALYVHTHNSRSETNRKTYVMLKYLEQDRFENELEFLLQIKNPNILTFYGACVEFGDYNLCFEGMDICLYEFCYRKSKKDKRYIIPEKAIGYISVIILDVLKYINEHGFAHGNICRKAVLMRRNGLVKVNTYGTYVCKG